jgi:hypothetical protein
MNKDYQRGSHQGIFPPKLDEVFVELSDLIDGTGATILNFYAERTMRYCNEPHIYPALYRGQPLISSSLAINSIYSCILHPFAPCPSFTSRFPRSVPPLLTDTKTHSRTMHNLCNPSHKRQDPFILAIHCLSMAPPCIVQRHQFNKVFSGKTTA